MNRFAAGILIAAGVLTLIPASAKASDFSDGLQLYKAKDYRGAAAKFEKAMAANPRDPNVIYYCALSEQLSNNRGRARQLYEYLTTNFPSSAVAGMARTGLSQLGGAASSAGSGGTGSSSSVTSAGGSSSSGEPEYLRMVPDEVRVPRMQRSGSNKGAYLECQLNGRPVMFHLDTGAHSTVIGANVMEQLGMGRPSGTQQFEIGGVGDVEHVHGWMQRADLKVGNIYRRDFPLTVIEHDDGAPLLGQDFLRDFNLTIDDNTILFRKKTARPRAIARGTIEIPFKVAADGRHMLVDTSVNGKPYVMIFDTGADTTCFSMKDLKRLGIPAPDGPPTGRSMGVKGETSTWSSTVDLKVGKVSKEGFPISVIDNSDMDHPLLGQTFFGGYKLNVDVPARMIRLTDPDM